MASSTSSLLPQKGAHPVSTNTVRLPDSLLKSCTLHLYYKLPPILFVDTHELLQRSASYSFEYWGTKDLERPVYALPDEVSELLINVIPEGHAIEDGEATICVEVPMHLRYGRPVNSEDKEGKPYQNVTVDWPKAFLQCSSSATQIPFTSPPPSFPPHILAVLPPSKAETILISIPPHANFSDSPQNTLTLPLGNSQDLALVEPLTALTILACFLWLLKISWKTAVRLDATSSSGRTKTA